MPFENHGSLSFSAVCIEKNAPAESGVYGLSNAQRWIYVGECANLKVQLLSHLHEIDPIVKAQAPTGFTYELCAAANRIARQNRLVLELEPVGNRRVAESGGE